MKRLLVIVPIMAMAAYGAAPQATLNTEMAEQTVSVHEDKPVMDNRHTLLDLAFSAVDKMPEDPHLKTKARLQYQLVGCALDAGKPDWAETYAEKVLYWEQGASYADIALYYAQHDHVSDAADGLARAETWLDNNELKFKERATEQAWRLERVRSKIAQAAIAIGNPDAVQKYRKDLGQGNAAQVVRCEALKGAGQNPEAALAKIDALAKGGRFDEISSASQGLIELYDLAYTNEAMRKAIEEKVAAYTATNTPFAFQVEMAIRMGETALKHGDAAAARANAAQGRKLLEAYSSTPRFRIPLAASLAALRCQAGEKAEGLDELAACLQLFKNKRETILSIDQAGILCSLAEAYQQVGEETKAVDLYSEAIDAGQLNPNSRPRAEDLCRICCFIARNMTEPSAELLRKLEKMNNGLGKPW